MHYYQFNIGDYRRDTAHLSHLEHGIYRSLIDTYMLEESPLPGDMKELERKHSIRTANEKKAKRNESNVNSRCLSSETYVAGYGIDIASFPHASVMP